MDAEKSIGKGESLQVGTRTIMGVTIGILVVLCLIAFGFTLIFPNRIGVRFVVRHPFPAPAVIPDERALRLSLQARQQRQLRSGDGHMPIQQAMQAVVERGAKAFDPASQ